MREVQIAAFIAGAVRLALPVLFAAVGELVSECAGVLNLSLEGMMLTGAFGATVGATVTGSAVVGVLVGAVGALLFAAGQASLTVVAGANQLVVGIAANALALGFTTTPPAASFIRARATSWRASTKSTFRCCTTSRSSVRACSVSRASPTSGWSSSL